MKHRLDALTERIVGAAIAVHRVLGPGLLESAYEACLTFDLVEGGLAVEIVGLSRRAVDQFQRTLAC